MLRQYGKRWMGQEEAGPGCPHPITVTLFETYITNVTSVPQHKHIALFSLFENTRPLQASFLTRAIELFSGSYLLPLWDSWKVAAAKVFLAR